jgi:hypothetical protein
LSMIDNARPDATSRAAAGLSTRLMEIAVALVILGLGSLVVIDSYRLGSKWGSDGPESGYFPFYIGLLLCISGLGTLAQTVSRAKAEQTLFVAWGPLKLVLVVLIPALLYVFAVHYLGLYVSSAIYIMAFMMGLGRYAWYKSAAVALAVSITFFLMFEVWFKVPLFKGSLDPLGFLGY